jgi:HEAT repeat protein
MITYFCPACWSVVPESAKTCSRCGAELGEYNQLSIEEKYLLALRHPVSENRIIAARFLGELGSQKALPEFERMLGEEQEYYVLREVVRALSLIPKPRARELLVTAGDHPYYLISYLAKRYLAQK